MRSSIPGEIERLGVPDIEDVVLAGGGVLELAGIRLADDIDLVTTLANREWLLDDDPKRWQKVVHRYKREKDGTDFQLTSVSDVDGRFDIWRTWFDKGRPQGNRLVRFEEMKENSRRHRLGFYVVRLEFMRELKLHGGRGKDLVDVALIDEYLKTR